MAKLYQNRELNQTWILSLRLYSAFIWESRLWRGIGLAGRPHFGLVLVFDAPEDELTSCWLLSLSYFPLFSSGDDGPSKDNWKRTFKFYEPIYHKRWTQLAEVKGQVCIEISLKRFTCLFDLNYSVTGIKIDLLRIFIACVHVTNQ